MEDLSLDPNISPPETMPSWPGETGSDTAGVFWKNGFLTCGGVVAGSLTNECHHLTLGASSSVAYPSMNVARMDFSHTIYQGRLWVTGGQDSCKSIQFSISSHKYMLNVASKIYPIFFDLF